MLSLSYLYWPMIDRVIENVVNKCLQYVQAVCKEEINEHDKASLMNIRKFTYENSVESVIEVYSPVEIPH